MVKASFSKERLYRESGDHCYETKCDKPKKGNYSSKLTLKFHCVLPSLLKKRDNIRCYQTLLK